MAKIGSLGSGVKAFVAMAYGLWLSVPLRFAWRQSAWHLRLPVLIHLSVQSSSGEARCKVYYTHVSARPSIATEDDACAHLCPHSLAQDELEALPQPVVVVIDALDEIATAPGDSSGSGNPLLRLLREHFRRLPKVG